MIEGIVLAAGMSTRMGQFKLTMNLNNKTIVENAIEGMYECCERIIVVSGHNSKEIYNTLKKYKKADIIYNKNYCDGMLSSVREGIRAAKGDRIFILPGDCPIVRKDIYRQMLSCDADILVPSYNGLHGHPVLIRRNIIEGLIYGNFISLRDFINQKGFDEVSIDDNCILYDIDYPEDYNKILSQFPHNFM